MEQCIRDIALKSLDSGLEAVRRTRDGVDQEFVSAVSTIVGCTGKVITSAVGTSHAVAWRLAHLLSCCGVPALFLHPADALHGSSGAVADTDVVVVISKGGLSEEVNAFARIARERGAQVISVSGTRKSPLAEIAHTTIAIPVQPDADIHGTIATSSSLAACAITDAICAAVESKRLYTPESFLRIHPRGAVGSMLVSSPAADEVHEDTEVGG